MEDDELKKLQSCIKDISDSIDNLLKNKIVNDNEEIKKVVGNAASEIGLLLDFDLLPRIRKIYPRFRERQI